MVRAKAGFFVALTLSTNIFLFSALAFAQTPGPIPSPTPVGKPKAEFAAASFDWGSVAQGAKVTHDFTLKNAGDADLTIQRVVPSCGCTATNTTSDHVAPSTETTVHVEIDTTGFAGENTKTVRLFTNDPENPFSTLTLKGAVEPDITVEPARLVFPEIIRDEMTQPPALTFNVKVRPGAAVSIKNVATYSKFLSLKELNGGEKERAVQVTLDPKIPNGEFRDRIVVNLSGGAVTALNVPVLATMKGRLQLKPTSVSFGIVEGAQTLTKHVRLENLAQEPVRVTHVSSDNAAITAHFSVVKPGKVFDIQIDVDPRKVTSDLHASVTIDTDSRSDDSLTLAVYGILPPKE